MTADLLALLVAVPLLAAVLPLFVALRSRQLAARLVTVVLLVQVGLAATVAWLVHTEGPVSFVVGAIPAGFGIGLYADRLTAAMLLLVALATVGAFLTAGRERSGPESSLWLLLVGGLTGVVVTADVFNLYVFLEISGLAAYALVGTRRGSEAALAALKYLLVGTVGATLYLLGVGYAFVATGTLAMADLAPALAAAGHGSTLVVTAYLLMAAGLGVKLALFPLHTWKPDAYAAASPDVAAVLAGLGSTVAGYALLRITYGVFTVEFLITVPFVRTLLLTVATVSVVAGGLLALRATDTRRLLAYSSVSQFGLFGVGLALATPLALTGAFLTLVGHAVAKAGLFVAVGYLAREHEATTVAELGGLGARAPLVSASVTTLGVSLVGLPPTVGFAGKLDLALGAVDEAEWTVAAVVVASTLLSLAYVGRVVERLYLAPGAAGPDVAVADGGSATARAVPVVVAAALAVVGLGLGSTALADWFAPVLEVWL